MEKMPLQTSHKDQSKREGIEVVFPNVTHEFHSFNFQEGNLSETSSSSSTGMYND